MQINEYKTTLPSLVKKRLQNQVIILILDLKLKEKDSLK